MSLPKRIITTLMIKNGVLYRSKKFKPDYRYTLNFVDMHSVDEIVLLDISENNLFNQTEKKLFVNELESLLESMRFKIDGTVLFHPAMTKWPSNLFSSKVSSPVNLCATKTDATAPPNNVTTPKFNNMIIIVKNFPKCVIGLTSPYPTVVNVTIDHQNV